MSSVVDFLSNAFKGRFGERGQNGRQIDRNIPEPERKLLGHLFGLLDDAQKIRDTQTAPWQVCFEYMMGKQLEPMPDWKADIVANEIQSKVETLLALTNQQRPRPEFQPEEDGLDDYADHMQVLFDEEWEREEMDEKKADCDKAAFTFGNSFYYIRWCDFEKEVKVTAHVPHDFRVAPGAKSLLDARYVIFERKMTLPELLLEYPEAADKVGVGASMIKNQDDYLTDTTQDATGGNGIPQYAFRVDTAGQADRTQVTEYLPTPGGMPDPSKDQIQVLEFWVRDLSTLHVKERDLESGDEQYTQHLLYPGGRHVVVADNRVILDEKNPYQHGRFPFVEQHCYRVPGRFWSKGVVQDLISPQDEVNKTLSHLIDNRNLMGNAQFLYTKKSGLDPKKITSEPGLGIPVQEMSDFARIPPPSMPQYISEIFGLLQGSMERISNVPAVAQGVQQRQMSGVAIETLLNTVNVTTAFMIGNMDQTMKRLAQMWLALLQQYNEEDRKVVMTDPITGKTKTGVMTADMIRKGWGVKVVIGSSVPLNRESRVKLAMEMVKVQLIDRQTALEEIRLPLAQRALKRMRMQEEQQHRMMLAIEQAKASAGGAPGGPPGGGPPGPGAPSGPVDASGAPVQSGPGGEGVYQG